ncbi:MAG: DUF4091 domain-containing protein [Deltaproteobacteria bacterium]|nr:DUF4091 domain-containing protein [Deltaproteobacteria bacterium]
MHRLSFVVVMTALGTLWAGGSVQAQNLVPNPGFEDGATGWNGGQVVTDSPHGGSACLLVRDDQTDSSLSAETADIIPVVQGQAYEFTLWVRAAGDGQQTLVTVNQYDSSDQWISGNNMDFVFTVGQAWSRFHAVIRNFNAATAGLRVVLRPVRWTEGGDLTGDAWFDDVVFAPVTESESVFGSWLHVTGSMRVWQSPVEQKVRPDTALDASANQEQGMTMAAARGEFEPVQVVLAPQSDDVLESVTISDGLDHATDAVLAADTWTLRRASFVDVTQPTDYASMTGLIPDPLPLIDGPISVQAGRAQPLWITVAVPADQPRGTYQATVTLHFHQSGDVTIPLVVRVWGFSMPKEHHLRTAYGLSTNLLDIYHNLGGDQAKRKEVFHLYLKDFAAHRISPYNPFGDDGFSVTFPNWNWEGGAVVPDPTDPNGGNHVLEVDDESTDRSVSAHTGVLVSINPTKTYELTWRVRTDGAHDYLVSMGQYDGSGQWISGSNLDHVQSGDGTWQTESVTVGPSDFAPNAASLQIRLFARPWTSGGEGTGRTWFDDVSLIEVGVNQNLVSNGDFDLPASQIDVSVDFDRYDEAGRFAIDGLGMDSFRLPLPGFAWGDYGGIHGGRILSFDWGTQEYEDVFCKELSALTDHLEQVGWLDRAYAYWMDEPHESDYDFVIQGMDLIHHCDPRLARLLTEQADSRLVGHVDIWTPVLDQYGVQWAHERQDQGDQVWWYVCTGPKAPYPNDFIDHPGIEHRVRFWMAWQYGVQGSLYWSTNYWTSNRVYPPPNRQDPWTDPMSYASVSGAWGNGDGRLLYPPKDWKGGQERIQGPVPSIRWELIREGIEDYEYFWMLRDAADRLEGLGGSPDLVAAARDLLSAPDSVFHSLTDYSQDPSAMHERRHEVAVLLEQIEDALAAVEGDHDRDGGLVFDGRVGDGGPQQQDGSVATGHGSGCSCRAGAGEDGSLPWPFLFLFVLFWRLGRGRHRPSVS